MIYLDSAATTPADELVLNVAMPYYNIHYGNPGSLHSAGRMAAKAICLARTKVAEFFCCDQNEIVFTSCGSEGNSTVFNTVKDSLIRSGRTHVLVSAVEHESVIRAAMSLEYAGFDVEFVPVGKDGVVSISVFEKMVKPTTGFVSIMYVNNEIGSVNPVNEIGKICKENNIIFHTDCVQAAGLFDLDVNKICCNYATISGHKINGLKGTGALYAKRCNLKPLILGGQHQEHGVRGGTENVPGIVALGEACRLTMLNMRDNIESSCRAKQEFYLKLESEIERLNINRGIVHINGARPIETGKILSMRFDGVDSQSLILMADSMGVCISAGSACQSKEMTTSHVLSAIGLSDSEARSVVRFSFSKDVSVESAREAAEIIARCLKVLLR